VVFEFICKSPQMKMLAKIDRTVVWLSAKVEVIMGSITGGVTGVIITQEFVTTLIQAGIIAAVTAAIGAAVGGFIKLWILRNFKRS
jgi:hypothetical protein